MSLAFDRKFHWPYLDMHLLCIPYICYLHSTIVVLHVDMIIGNYWYTILVSVLLKEVSNRWKVSFSWNMVCEELNMGWDHVVIVWIQRLCVWGRKIGMQFRNLSLYAQITHIISLGDSCFSFHNLLGCSLSWTSFVGS